MRVDEVELRVIRVPFRAPVRTSYGTETHKTCVLATVRADGVAGLGEGVMEPLPHYREENIAGALELMRHALVPDLLGGPVQHPGNLVDRWSSWRGNPMAKATLEHAAWDLFARLREEPLGRLLGADRREIPVGASLGIASVADTVEQVGRHLEQGYRRVKLKIEPGHDLEVLAAVRDAFATADLTADANAAYTLDDLDTLRGIDEFGLQYLEQPLHWDDLTHHAALARHLRTPLCLDESLTSPERVVAALELGACGVVNLKPGRVGGLEAARRIHDLCAAQAVPLWCGGMYETGVGRAHNIHLAAMPGFVLPGDTASASRTYERDVVVQPLETVGGLMPVPAGPGIGVDLDHDFVAACTEHVEVHRR